MNMRIIAAGQRRQAGRGPVGRPLVFVVDDDAATLALIGELAEEAGWQSRGFACLDDGLRALDETTPSLLILDDDLPDGRGGDLAREIRTDPRLNGVPVLVCTAAHPMRRAEIGHWAPVMAKPFDLDAIEHFLRAAAGRRGGTSMEEQAG